jgi:tRNA pseudouridine55 synthase
LSRRRKGRAVHGVLLLDKPAGPSSNQALQRVRRLFQARKAGHTGTLDPFATGMLPVCFGEASKTSAQLLDASKTYEAEALLGQATTTGDSEGDVIMEAPVPHLDDAAIERVLATLRGAIEQVPPMFSALKHEGRPLYEWARKGVTIPREPRQVTIHSLELLSWKPPYLRFRVTCSKGTYVRTLAEDMASGLGTVAHLVALRRLRVGLFEAGSMVTMDALEAAAESGTLDAHLLPVDAGLADWPVVQLDEAGGKAFANGNPAPVADAGERWSGGGRVVVRDARNQPLGIGEMDRGQQCAMVRPRKVFVFDD